MKESTLAFLFAVAVASSLGNGNKMVRSHPVLTRYAMFQVIIGSLLMYLGFNPHIVF